LAHNPGDQQTEMFCKANATTVAALSVIEATGSSARPKRKDFATRFETSVVEASLGCMALVKDDRNRRRALKQSWNKASNV